MWLPWPKTTGFYIAEKKDKTQDMVAVISVAKSFLEIEISGKKVKVGRKDYFRWCPIHSEDAKVLYKTALSSSDNAHENSFVYITPPKVIPPSWEKIPENTYIISHSLRDLEDSPDLKWYKVDASGELRSIDNVALFEITVRQGVHTFIGFKGSSR